MTRAHLWITVTTLCTLLGIAAWLYLEAIDNDAAITLAVLVPDDVDANDPHLTAWLDAAEEEGVPLEIIRAHTLLRPFPFGGWLHLRRFAGIILPDTIHKAASDILLTALDTYVREGGKLMITFDAGTLTLPGQAYAPQKSRLSELVGIDYAFYDQLKDTTIRHEQVFASDNTFMALHIPPGKFYRDKQNPASNGKATLFTYKYGALRYAHFVTQGIYQGHELMRTSDNELVAGVRQHAKGNVMFVNLPLGFLKTRTDGMLLHGFLRYFGEHIAALPSLSNTPNGRGGLIMNLHVDSNAVFPVLRQLKSAKIFSQGPYSIHITAGPDTSEPHDKLGFDLLGNPEAAEWLKFFEQRNDIVGSHGGWIHNYFGYNVSESNRNQFEPYLLSNKQAIESVINKPVTEYSAPLGTHPVWVTQWLETQNISAYYFTGNTGMGPTKTYRDGKRSFQKTWAFPVMTMGKHASIEELYEDRVPKKETTEWLKSVTDFTAKDHSIRLIYFHPTGILHYLDSIEAWLDHTQKLKEQRRFSWYTMTDIASFLSAREKVKWKITKPPSNKTSTEIRIEASHPDSLARQSWRLATDHYMQPKILKGTAEVIRDGNAWLINARAGKHLVFTTSAASNKL